MVKMNHHKMEIYLQAFDKKDLLVVIVLFVLCARKLHDFLAQFLMTHLEFGKTHFQF